MRVRKIKTSENLKVFFMREGVSEANKTSEGRVAPVASPLQLGGLGGAVSPPKGVRGAATKIFEILLFPSLQNPYFFKHDFCIIWS